MKVNVKQYHVLWIFTFLLFFLSLNILNINFKYISFIAAFIIFITGMKLDFLNSLFLNLFFNFSYFSFHSDVSLNNLIINVVIFTLFGILGEKINSNNVKDISKIDDNNNEFLTKIINLLIFTHELISEIKVNANINHILEIFYKNLKNLLKIKSMIFYSKNNDYNTFELEYFFGIEKEDILITNLENLNTKGEIFKRNLPNKEFNIVKEENINVLILPIEGNSKKTNEKIIIFLSEKEFNSSDIYLIEISINQIFIFIKNQKLLNSIQDSYEKVVKALSIAIDTKDHETHGHSLLTMEYAVKLAKKLNLSEDEINDIKYASLLHDIGKINISNKILNKPGPLNEEEYNIIKTHPEEGINILKEINIFNNILSIILHHHERCDGKGYPKGLKNDEIPVGAKICAIADAYSVMRSNRPYRKALSKEEAIEELKRCAGTQFDKELVEIFLEILKDENEKLDIYNKAYEKN